MITPKTIRKLSDKQALVYKITRHPVMMCGVSNGGDVEYFSTMAQARNAQSNWIGTSTVESEQCSMDKHYLRT